MNVGLPGTGIGGMFYLLSAVCMPLVEALRSLRHRDGGQWRVVGRQAVMALAIGAGIWVTGWLLALVLAGSPQAMAALRGGGTGGRVAPNVVRAATLAMSLGTLAAVIVSVWVARVWVHGWGRGELQGAAEAGAGSRGPGAAAEAVRSGRRRPAAAAGKPVPEYDAA